METGRVLVTRDADFLRLQAQGLSHCGVAYRRQGSGTIGDMVLGLLLIREVYTPAEMRNRVEFL